MHEAETAILRIDDAAFRVSISPLGVFALRFVPPDTPGEGPHFGLAQRVEEELAEYLAGRRRDLDLPVDLEGCSPFQRQVLQACARIPVGQVATYAELAKQIGRPGAARAVGTALARNPVPLLVPCHRVLRGDGGLGGFIAGLAWKRRLLVLEGVTLR